jgi:hypothetical protein
VNIKELGNSRIINLIFKPAGANMESRFRHWRSTWANGFRSVAEWGTSLNYSIDKSLKGSTRDSFCCFMHESAMAEHQN